MANLQVEFCGLKFKNPILPAAGPPGWNGEALERCADGGAGGLVSKTISVERARVPTPNMAAVRGAFLNTELWSEIPPRQWALREYVIAKATELPLIVSLGYSAEDIATLAQIVKPFADALELSTHYIGDDPQPMMDAIRAAQAVVDVPVFVKLSPFRDIKTAALAAQQAGAHGIVAINSFGPTMTIDVETGAPVMGSQSGYGWMSGPAIRPLAVRCVFDIARTVDLPIMGVGGVGQGIDAVELIMAGANAVQVCTAAILHGPTIYAKITTEIDTWLDEHGYTSINDIRGLAIARWREHTVRYEHVPPDYDPNKCIGCGRCEQSCVYLAIHVEEKKAVLHGERCYGCGLCVTRCPTQALAMPY
jgi:dihydroorotate dehydrogenase (NAD+) catalytic subunit